MNVELIRLWERALEKAKRHSRNSAPLPFTRKRLQDTLSYFIEDVHFNMLPRHQFMDLFFVPHFHSAEDEYSPESMHCIHDSLIKFNGSTFALRTPQDHLARLKKVDAATASISEVGSCIEQLERASHQHRSASDYVRKCLQDLTQLDKSQRETFYEAQHDILQWEYFSHFVHRTFLETLQSNRDQRGFYENGAVGAFSVLLKTLNADKAVIEDVRYKPLYEAARNFRASLGKAKDAAAPPLHQVYAQGHKSLPGLRPFVEGVDVQFALARLAIENYASLPIRALELFFVRTPTVYPLWMTAATTSVKANLLLPYKALMQELGEAQKTINYYAYYAHKEAYRSEIGKHCEGGEPAITTLISGQIAIEIRDRGILLGAIRVMNKFEKHEVSGKFRLCRADDLTAQSFREDKKTVTAVARFIEKELAAQIAGDGKKERTEQ